MTKRRIFTTPFAKVYPHYVPEGGAQGPHEGRGRPIIRWLTGYDAAGLQKHIAAETDFETFFAEAPALTRTRR